MMLSYKFLIFLALISSEIAIANPRNGGVLGTQNGYRGYGRDRPMTPNPNAIKRWRVSNTQGRRGTPASTFDVSEQEPMVGPPKPPRNVPRDYDDLIDGSSDDNDLDSDVEDEDDIKCLVETGRPYGTSPKITLTGVRERYNSLLVGYDVHTEGKRANKASLYGWSSPKSPSEDGISKFHFDLDYVSILPQGGIPLSYCALVFVPPVVPKFDMRSVFGKPAMSMERYFASEEHLVKALKKKSRKVTSCCFIAYPLVSRR